MTWKFIHMLGICLFVGNNLVTPFWKMLADRTRDGRVVAFAQRLIALTDWIFTLGGVVLLATAGYVLAARMPGVWGQDWLFWGHALFVASGIIWGGVLLPLQWKMGALARGFADGSPIPEAYWRLNRIWSVVGVVASLLPLFTLWLMVVKM